MRNDLRRERKLPGFFHREVYDILDGGGPSSVEPEPEPKGDKSLVLSLAPWAAAAAETENEVVFDSGRTSADDGLFSDEVIGSPEKDCKEALTAPTPISPISATQYEPSSQTQGDQDHDPDPDPDLAPAAATTTQDNPIGGPDQGRKRRRSAIDEADEEMSLQKQLIGAMERNGRLLGSQLEIQNTNSQLDREQRKDDANNLFAVLNKLADAMVQIADKLDSP